MFGKYHSKQILNNTIHFQSVFGNWLQADSQQAFCNLPDLLGIRDNHTVVRAITMADWESYMSAVIIEHVNVADLPETWRAKLSAPQTARVTVRIEPEETPANLDATGFVTSDPAFGIWRDREDMTDVEAYLRKLRAPRYNRDGSRNED
jgi:hypothetical protein